MKVVTTQGENYLEDDDEHIIEQYFLRWVIYGYILLFVRIYAIVNDQFQHFN